MPASAVRRLPSRGTSTRIRVAWLTAITIPAAASDAPIIASDQPKRNFV